MQVLFIYDTLSSLRNVYDDENRRHLKIQPCKTSRFRLYLNFSFYVLVYFFIESVGQWDNSILFSLSIFTSPKAEHAVFKGDKSKTNYFT